MDDKVTWSVAMTWNNGGYLGCKIVPSFSISKQWTFNWQFRQIGQSDDLGDLKSQS